MQGPRHTLHHFFAERLIAAAVLEQIMHCVVFVFLGPSGCSGTAPCRSCAVLGVVQWGEGGSGHSLLATKRHAVCVAQALGMHHLGTKLGVLLLAHLLWLIYQPSQLKRVAWVVRCCSVQLSGLFMLLLSQSGAMASSCLCACTHVCAAAVQWV